MEQTSISNVEASSPKTVEEHLIGRKIVGIFYLPESEAKELAWDCRPIVIKLDDGSHIYPIRDDEGNNGGALATDFGVLPTYSMY